MFTRNASRVSCSALASQISCKSFSNYLIHPERLKQILKERDGHNLCNYYDSDSYKMKAVDVVEEQSRIIDELTPRRIKEGVNVTYEHMINCAQPRRKHKIFVVMDDQNVNSQPKGEQNSLIRRLLRVRGETGENESETRRSRKVQATLKTPARKYRKRTTILPLYLKKIQDNQAMKQEKIKDDHSDSEEENTKVAYQITKSEYKAPARAYQKLKLKQKVLNAEYQNEVIRRRKPPPKYTLGSEEEKQYHWYLNHDMMKMLDYDDDPVPGKSFK